MRIKFNIFTMSLKHSSLSKFSIGKLGGHSPRAIHLKGINLLFHNNIPFQLRDSLKICNKFNSLH